MQNSLIQNFTPRLYQETIFATVAQYNTLVVLPTGLGKTALALLLVAHRLQQHPESKCLILTPTKPLADQHTQTLQKHLPALKEKILTFTGEITPEKRTELWKTAQIIISTPQGLENDIISNRINLNDVSALVVDEAHRATGEYSYVWITKQYQQRSKYPRVLALTASPGSEMEHIQEIVTNLGIEKIEVRTENDPDVEPYIQEVALHWEYVEFPNEFVDVQKYFKACFQKKIDTIKELGVIEKNSKIGDSKTEILKLQGNLHGEIASGNKGFEVLRAISLSAEAMKVQHAIELLETQGIKQLFLYLEDIMKQSQTSSVKAVKNLVADSDFKSAYIKTQSLVEKNVEHPKLPKLRDILIKLFQSAKEKGYGDYKVIIFTQYRDTGTELVRIVNALPLASKTFQARLFVGQAKKRGSGLTQKEQLGILEDFKNGKFQILISSSVGEEGLDIPQVDAVLFFEPIPSAIRHIQRKGRTGRHGEGEVIILVTKGTRDEGYRWSAHHKERRMYRNLAQLKKSLVFASKEEKKEKPLYAFMNEEERRYTIFIDHREKGNPVIKELLNAGIKIDLQQLETGDYLLSSRCAVEYKTVADFVDSLLDGRLLQQAKEMKKRYGRPLYIIEGMEDMYSVRNVHPNAIRGMLAALAIDFGIPILQTKSAKETASLLMTVAKREQEAEKREVSLHGDRKPISIKEQQEYVMTAFPGIGQSLVKPLLKEFKTIKNFINANKEELKKVQLIGDKKAKQIKDVIEIEWKEFD